MQKEYDSLRGPLQIYEHRHWASHKDRQPDTMCLLMGQYATTTDAALPKPEIKDKMWIWSDLNFQFTENSGSRGAY